MSDDSKGLYRLANQKQQTRVEEFARVDDPTSRRNEIAVCRTLIEEALHVGNTSVANSLLNTLDRLQKNEFRRQLIEHELLTRPAIMRFAKEMVAIFGEEVAALDGWEDVLNAVSERVGEAVDTLRNDAKDIERIPLPR